MTEELVMRLREDARYGYGAACDWSDEERADYWAQQCRKARRNAAEAADAIERLTYDGIHTCHDDCPRLPCVQRREIDALRGEIRRLTNELQAHKDALAQVKGSSYE